MQPISQLLSLVPAEMWRGCDAPWAQSLACASSLLLKMDVDAAARDFAQVLPAIQAEVDAGNPMLLWFYSWCQIW
jgi:hypothetical protein